MTTKNKKPQIIRNNSSRDKEVELTKDQILMLEMALQDLKEGKTINHNKLFNELRSELNF